MKSRLDFFHRQREILEDFKLGIGPCDMVADMMDIAKSPVSKFFPIIGYACIPSNFKKYESFRCQLKFEFFLNESTDN